MTKITKNKDSDELCSCSTACLSGKGGSVIATVVFCVAFVVSNLCGDVVELELCLLSTIVIVVVALLSLTPMLLDLFTNGPAAVLLSTDGNTEDTNKVEDVVVEEMLETP